eukprot:m.138056 g.138056  ORF g.138056 m.138056 type:complete len:495 (+) comp9945_c0_seq1:2968-4452(+)
MRVPSTLDFSLSLFSSNCLYCLTLSSPIIAYCGACASARQSALRVACLMAALSAARISVIKPFCVCAFVLFADRSRKSKSITSKSLLRASTKAKRKALAAAAAAEANGKAVKGLLGLPDEMLMHILGFLTHKELGIVASVSRRFGALAIDPSLWRRICIVDQQVTMKSLGSIGRRRPIELMLHRCAGLDPPGLVQLLKNTAKSITHLELVGVPVSSAVLQCVAQHLPFLQRLDLSWSGISDRALFRLAEGKLEHLRALCLKGCQRITDDGLARICACLGETIFELDLFGCFLLTPNAVLNIGGHCRQLRRLNLAHCTAIDDHAIGWLAQQTPYLEVLCLNGCKLIRDGCLEKLGAHCPRLRDLRLAQCLLVTDTGIVSIVRQCARLSVLDLSSNQCVTQEVLGCIAGSLRSMEELYLERTNVSEAALEALFGLSALRILTLDHCVDVAPEGLHGLVASAPLLTQLSLFGCRRVTSQVVAELRALNPTLTIHSSA